MEIRIEMPVQAEEIIEKLNRRGFEAYAVGGCVRDSLLGRTPEDWDITTSAMPWQVKEIFGRTIDTGIRHGTVTILRDGAGYEVTTYRIDGEYVDGRHPSSVAFTSSLTEDLRRRDFTMNAMAYSPKAGLVDVFGGLEDLRAGIIRCVGSASERFTEDALRILRAIRFAAQLNFVIEETTRQAISQVAPNLVHVSRERIQMELTKLLLSDHPERMAEVFESGAAEYLFPAFARIPWKRMASGAGLPARKHLRWAMFLKDLQPEEAAAVLRELKMDRDTIVRVSRLLTWLRRPAGLEEEEIRRTMSQMPGEAFDDLLLLKEALAADKREGIPETEAQLARIRLEAEAIRRRGDCLRIADLAVTGKDLMEAGMKPGPQLGETLNQLLELVLRQPERNVKKELLEEAARIS